MQKNLVIVESPAKAKTLEKFLGKDYKVMSSYGHIRDLKKKEMSVNLDDFSPEYEIPADKEYVVRELKKAAEKAETVWLASDEDREGEAISWHLSQVLGLDPKAAKRIVFHEITKTAILEAIELYDCTPSYSQACRLHRDSEMMYAADTRERILSVMSEEKPNQREKVSFQYADLKKYFPSSYTPKQISDAILRLVEADYRRRRDRDAR